MTDNLRRVALTVTNDHIAVMPRHSRKLKKSRENDILDSVWSLIVLELELLLLPPRR